MTRLCGLHPYPAMIADSLAIDLAARFTTPSSRVLDPFCGTARTIIAAAARGASTVGVDVNPLACLISRAKVTKVPSALLFKLIDVIPEQAERAAARRSNEFEKRELVAGRKVQWFSLSVRRELSALLTWLNELRLDQHERLLVGAILSATVREVSFCRDDQWKLHRISKLARRRFSASPWLVFRRRLTSVAYEIERTPPLPGAVQIVTGNTRNLASLLASSGCRELFDVVLTSPPYGDSRTTVQYGAMSSISLAVLRHMKALDVGMMLGGEIDRVCLGGAMSCDKQIMVDRRYWRGGRNNEARRRVAQFLQDVELSCVQVASVMKRGGTAVFVTSRRRVGGWRLHLDEFIVDALEREGLKLCGGETRRIIMKRTPFVIDRQGRSGNRKAERGAVRTMREERILSFRKL